MSTCPGCLRSDVIVWPKGYCTTCLEDKEDWEAFIAFHNGREGSMDRHPSNQERET